MRAPNDTVAAGLFRLSPPRPHWPALPGLHRRDPRGLSDRQLGRRWRATYAGVRTARTMRMRLALVQERQGLLDELERRHPEAFRALTRWDDWRAIDDW